MFGIGLGVGALSAIGATILLWLVWLVVRRWGPRRIQGPASGFPAISTALILSIFALPVGCAWAFAPRPQPDSVKQVAAIEMPLRTDADRADLVAMLRRHAYPAGLHVDDVSGRWREFEAQSKTVAPEQRGTIFVGVWRGARDNDLEVDVGDSGHPGRTWVTFFNGRKPKRSAQFREELLREIYGRWPETRKIPVMPNGALPLVNDLVWTGNSYMVKPERMAAYAKSTGNDPR